MTKLPLHGMRLSPNTCNLSEEDRSTHRKWARGWYLCCAIFIAGLLAVSLSTREPNMRTAGQGQIVGVGTGFKPVRMPHPGG